MTSDSQEQDPDISPDEIDHSQSTEESVDFSSSEEFEKSL